MSTKEDDTFRLIVNTAKQLFFKEGKFNATTQEIADAAGVNRTLINYYFRSRDALFDIVFMEAKQEQDKKQEIIVTSELTVRQKLEQFMDLFFEMAANYPYLEMYLVNHMNKHESCILKSSKHVKRMLDIFYVQLEEEMEKGNIQKMEPVHFVLNFISMLSFPVSMRPLIQEGMELSDQEYDKIISERKQVILQTIFKNENF